jgi:hypothetical protein
VVRERYILSQGIQPFMPEAENEKPQRKKIKISGPKKKGYLELLVNMTRCRGEGQPTHLNIACTLDLLYLSRS